MKLFLRTLRLGLYSLWLDWQLLAYRFPVTFTEKCEFLCKKYLLIIKHHFLGIPLNSSLNKVFLGKRECYYGSVFGIAVFQSAIITLNKFIIPILETIDRPVIIDVGAHLGFFSLPLAALLTNPRIYACEPVSITYNLLSKNIRSFSSIKTFHLGLSNKIEKKTIYYNPNLLMYSSLFSKRFTWDKHPYRETVHLKTLDSFCKENNVTSINLLKIDAEGAEERILKGGDKTLTRTQYLFIECSLDETDHSTFTTLVSSLVGNGYNFQLIKIISSLEHEGRLLLVNLLFKNLLYK